MTYVGKILVIVIMAFSLIFLGISTVVFTTSKNWRTATEEQKKKVSELKKKLNDAQAGVAGRRERTRPRPRAASTPWRPAVERQDQAARGREQAVAGSDHRRPAARWASPRRTPRRRWTMPTPAARRRCCFASRSRPSRSRPTSSSSAGRAQRQDPRAGADARDGDQEQRRPPRAGRQVLDPAPAERALRRHQPDQGDREPAAGRRARSSGWTRPTGGSRSPSARMTAWSSATSCTSTGQKPRPEYLGKITIISVDPDQAVGRVDRHDLSRARR